MSSMISRLFGCTRPSKNDFVEGISFEDTPPPLIEVGVETSSIIDLSLPAPAYDSQLETMEEILPPTFDDVSSITPQRPLPKLAPTLEFEESAEIEAVAQAPPPPLELSESSLDFSREEPASPLVFSDDSLFEPSLVPSIEDTLIPSIAETPDPLAEIADEPPELPPPTLEESPPPLEPPVPGEVDKSPTPETPALEAEESLRPSGIRKPGFVHRARPRHRRLPKKVDEEKKKKKKVKEPAPAAKAPEASVGKSPRRSPARERPRVSPRRQERERECEVPIAIVDLKSERSRPNVVSVDLIA